MTLQNVANALVANLIPEVPESPGNSVIAPALVFSRKLDDQGLDFYVDSWSAWIMSILGAVELLRDQSAMPAQKGVGLDDVGYLLQSFLAKPLTNLGQRLPFTVGQTQATLDLVSKNAVLGRQVLVPQQEFLINRARDVGQQFLPVHRLSNMFGGYP